MVDGRNGAVPHDKRIPSKTLIDADRGDWFEVEPRRPAWTREVDPSAVRGRLARAVRSVRGKAKRVPRILRLRQRCAVKVRYGVRRGKYNANTLRGPNKAAWLAHAYYISRPSTTELPRDVSGFNQSSESLKIRQPVSAWWDARDCRMFRIVISPENKCADLRKLTRDVMDDLGKALGRNLEWIAAVHTWDDKKNIQAEHPHVHVLLRGSADEFRLILPCEMIKSGIRNIARDHLTDQLGYRLVQQIEPSPARALTPVTSLQR